ncbi:MAG: hypothetical protein J4G11_05820 [Acidimicrobiia bacterium]|nr:hypothetical protein [Acidimicrobiia bacterium]
MYEYLRSHRIRITGAALAVALIAGACSSDSESEPAPTVTTTTVASTTTAPTTTTSPATTTTTTLPATTPTATVAQTETGQPSGTLADLFVDESTTYQDVMDRISEDERACIKAAFGEMVYTILVTRPVLTEDAASDPDAVTRLLSCLTQDNVVMAMLVYRDAAAGRINEETRRCVVPLALQIPESYYEHAGLEWEGERVSAKELAEINSQLLQCFPAEEVAALQFRIYQQVVEMVPMVWSDVTEAFTEAERDCFREHIGDDEFTAILDSPLRGGGAMSDHELHEACFGRDTPGRLYAAFVGMLLGTDLTEESAICMIDFAADHEHYIDYLLFTPYEDKLALEAETRAEFLQDGYRLHSCFNDDESQRWNNLYLEAFQRS